jgi:hypothetical protein
MFHSYSKDTDNLTKWEFYSDDDDVLLWVEGDYILANIEEIVEMRQSPVDKTTLTRGNALRSGTVRDRVAMKYAPNRVAMLLRLYQEANAGGKILETYQNQTMSYWHLPRMTTNPLDYWLSESVLGHVRLKPVEKIGRRKVTRYFKEQDPSEKADLMSEHQN